MKVVSIFGLGYVGLPMMCLAATKGYNVIGVDINKEIVDLTNQGICHIKDDSLQRELIEVHDKIAATTDGTTATKKSDIIIICVPTPVDSNNYPNIEPVRSVAKTISKGLKKEQLIILESTVYSGTTEEIVKPILEESGLNAEEDFYLAYCPERIDPGNREWDVKTLPRVIGALSKEGLKRAVEFYNSILDSEIYELSSIKAVEATKIVENIFRDVNIALVNELAKSFDKLGIDTIEVIKGASTKPFAFLPHYPGCGVGGHCIPVDPYYMIEKSRKEGFNPKFLILAREINNSMPGYTIKKVIEGLNEIGKSVKGTKVAVLGLAYKGNIDDTRKSPAYEIIRGLQDLGAHLTIYDPYVLEQSTVQNINDALKNECLVLVTNHDEFKSLTIKKLKQSGVKVIIDGRNLLNKNEVIGEGIIYKGIGR